uniref:LITAF domain-containing protein n=1 Tax=Meloidogyne incognita TaxID=6306 RepID=A0A914LHQ5_MELIC
MEVFMDPTRKWLFVQNAANIPSLELPMLWILWQYVWSSCSLSSICSFASFCFHSFFLPFFLNYWKDAEHRCSVCNTYIGKFIREYEDHRYGRRRTVVVIQPPMPPPQPQVQPVILAPVQAYTPPTSPPPYPRK